MVFCGKPSRGCGMCRKRRIKCDEGRPICYQCTKSRRDCPGYKDEFDLMFRNETEATAIRARKANVKAMASKKKRDAKKGLIAAASATAPDPDPDPVPCMDAGSPVSTTMTRSPPASVTTFKSAVTSDTSPPPSFADFSTSSTEFVDPAIFLDQIRVPFTPTTPILDQAVCHFMSNFVIVPRHKDTKGFLDFLPPLLDGAAVSVPLRHIVNACSLAYLSHRIPGAKRSRCDALAEYGKALKAMMKAQSDPKERLKDGTLAAVLMLGLFENMTSQKLGQLAWGNHIRKAIELVRDRDRKQLKTKIGLMLFIAARTQMIVYCVASGSAPIKDTDWWLEDAIKNEVAAGCIRINIKMAELRCEVARLLDGETTPHRSRVDNLIRDAQLLDQECVGWAHTVPPIWRFRTILRAEHTQMLATTTDGMADSDFFPGGRIDLYQDIWIASVWNMARVCRITLASLIVRLTACLCTPADYRQTPHYEAAQRIAQESITDIVASVPYHLGWHLQPQNRQLVRQAKEFSHIHMPFQVGAEHPILFPCYYSSEQHNEPPSHFISGFACGEEDTLNEGASTKGVAGYFLTWPLATVHSADFTTDAQRKWVEGRLRYIGDQLGVKYAHALADLKLMIPSMLIKTGGAVRPSSSSCNFEKLVSAKCFPSAAEQATIIKGLENDVNPFSGYPTRFSISDFCKM